ncbi:hypothetical protein AB0O01_23670 [Streptomyces sp. NPDC093252]|uniref:hypothetical protein n=1 Tax=Streptomyces sp. NPDC093252 TaxID=3154980 RepID=UPI00343D0207
MGPAPLSPARYIRTRGTPARDTPTPVRLRLPSATVPATEPTADRTAEPTADRTPPDCQPA